MNSVSVNTPTEEQIRKRAYEIYLQRGCQHGHDRDDWLQAEYELLQLPVRKLAQLPLPKSRTSGARKGSIVALVQMAMVLGSAALPHIQRS